MSWKQNIKQHADCDESVKRWPYLQSAADIKALQPDRSPLQIVRKQQSGDQVPRDDEEQIDTRPPDSGRVPCIKIGGMIQGALLSCVAAEHHHNGDAPESI